MPVKAIYQLMKAPKLEKEAVESKQQAYYSANQALPGRARGLPLTNKPALECMRAICFLF